MIICKAISKKLRTPSYPPLNILEFLDVTSQVPELQQYVSVCKTLEAYSVSLVTLISETEKLPQVLVRVCSCLKLLDISEIIGAIERRTIEVRNYLKTATPDIKDQLKVLSKKSKAIAKLPAVGFKSRKIKKSKKKPKR